MQEIGNPVPTSTLSKNLDIPEPLWKISKEKLESVFQTNLAVGLTEDVAQLRMEQYGLNEIPSASQGFLKVYLAPLFNWLIVIYFGAALLMLIVGLITKESQMTMIFITLAIVGLNAIVAIFQQARATKKLEALKELTAPSTTVIRNGQKQKILTKHVVIGDIIEINTGDRIPADARIFEANNLKIDEASLTGESEPVSKNKGESIDQMNIPLQNQINILFYGTYAASGNGKALVFATGAQTEIGKISTGIIEADTGEIPIRTKLNNIGKWFGLGVMGIWLIVLIILMLTKENVVFAELVIESLNSAMDIMPINIPLLTTVIMLTGVLAMADHGVIIRNLTSVDSLGRVSVVCSDKTGTLTKNEMSVQRIWTLGKEFEVTGTGYEPKGLIQPFNNQTNNNLEFQLEDFPALKLLLVNSYLNNNASLIKEEIQTKNDGRIRWKILGLPTEGALLTLAHKADFSPIGKYPIKDKYTMIQEFPFTSKLKRMTKIFTSPENTTISFTKGASEIIINACSHILQNSGEIVECTDELRLVVMNEVVKYAQQGYRILSFGYKEVSELPSDLEKNRVMFESDLTYLGFVAIMDPPRERVAEAVDTCHDAGIDVVMITGDSQPTAAAIGRQINILNSQEHALLDGVQMKDVSAETDLSQVRIFSRVSPQDKQKIVENFQNHNRVVAMTGDGVNDALALNMADAGVAMGIQGTDVAKESADMIISDDSFRSIVEGVRRGRGIFANIRSIVFFFICINLFEGIVQFLLAVIFDLPYFLDLEFNEMWIFLSITLHLFPSLILTFDTVSKDVMQETPRDSEEILSKKILYLMLIYGGLLAISMVLSYFTVYSWNYPIFEGNTSFGNLDALYLYSSETSILWEGIDLRVAKTLTMLMATLYFCECALALQIRRPNKSLWKSLREEGNRFMYLVIGLLFGVFLALMYIPGLQTGLAIIGLNFHFMALTIVDWLVCFAYASICIGSFEFIKWVARKKNIVF